MTPEWESERTVPIDFPEDDDMIKVTGINNTACGILAAESENNGQTGYTFAIRHIYVNEDWRGKGA